MLFGGLFGHNDDVLSLRGRRDLGGTFILCHVIFLQVAFKYCLEMFRKDAIDTCMNGLIGVVIGHRGMLTF